MALSLVDVLAPHYCLSCGEIGAPLCEYCKYDIVTDPFANCLVCQGALPGSSQLCKSCQMPFSKAWCVGGRHDVLRDLIDNFKFERNRAISRTLADLLDETVPVLPANTHVTFVPTVPSHIRQRGYDHAELIAKALARRRRLRAKRLLTRLTTTHQRGKSRRERLENAARAFAVENPIEGPVLLIDDIYTTGATVAAAASKLREAGAEDVWVAVVARQPLEKVSSG